MIALPSPLAPLSRLLQPLAPAWVQDAWPRAAQSRLAHCLLLAFLLHVWLVLMLGNAPPGTAPPGQGVWGALNVTLRGPAQGEPLPGAAAPAPQPTGLPGTAASPRAGGSVRAPSPQPQPLPEPGAARRGDWAVVPALPALPAARVLPMLNEPAAEPVGPPRLSMTPSPPVPPPLPEPPAERRLGALPGLSAATARAVPLERVAAPRSVVAPVPPPPALPDAAALTPLAAAPTAPTAPTATPTPQAAPAPPASPPAVSAAAPSTETPPAVPEAPALRQVATMAATARPAPALPPVQGVAAQAPVVGLPSLPAGPTGAPLAALPAGRPDAGPQVGHDVATAPSAPASAAPLNLEWVRPRGGELSRKGGAGVLPLLPKPPELPDKLARDIDKAAKADCRKAHQGMGLLAVVPLAVDAARGGKGNACKW